jgi:hypothetical protein
MVLGCLATDTLASKQPAKPVSPPDYAVGRLSQAAPFIILQAGDTTWVQVHDADSRCPGDPLGGHGGEADGGPEGSETWCFEANWPYGDSCGTYAPWDTRCYRHVDVKSLPSEVGINYWHVSNYRTDQRAYCGDSALWCGADSMWNGAPTECGTWINPPGYGSYWNCVAQLTLPETFDIANGCSIMFDTRYDTECKYDYFYVEYYDGIQWQQLALFNATSNNPGAECGQPGGGNPDFWGNTDTQRLINCDWQSRGTSGVPAYHAYLDASNWNYTSGPMIRWRFESDGGFSDADGSGNTDGAAFIDNVTIVGDTETYVMDFETGLDSYWSFPNPDGVIDQWHMSHDPDPPYEGGDGGDRTTCTLDSSIVWRARPEGGYPTGVPWRNGWFYRLVMPTMPLLNTGCVVQYDQYMCAKEITCDYTNTMVRFRDYVNDQWCPWIDIDDFNLTGGCFFWNFDFEEDVTPFYGSTHDSMQFGFDLKDVSVPGQFCRGKHRGTENIIDNISIGFFDGDATVFRAQTIDLLNDSFFPGMCGFNAQFDAYDPDTINYYSGEVHPLPVLNTLRVDVTDKDEVDVVELFGSMDGGATWVSVSMTMFQAFDPQNPNLGGEFTGTLCPSDFSLSEWPRGTQVWYYVKCTDGLSNEEYFPNEANPVDPDHTGTDEDYYTFDILPRYPESFTGVKLLLVDGYGRNNYDYSQCFAAVDNLGPLEDIYERTLVDAGYCYDKYDVAGAGSNIHIHYLCTWNTDYDAVIWFGGPYFSDDLFDAEAQREMRNYLAGGGKVVLLGDRVAYSAASEAEGGGGEDSLGGEFLAGIMGADYLEEMASPFAKPYIYCRGVPTLNVLGTPTSLDLDTMLVYRECPYLKDMSWVRTEPMPPAGYTAQALMNVLNPDVTQADMAIYTEYQGVGQCAFVNFDLCAAINHTYAYCSGGAPAGYQPFTPGGYEGRVDLIRTILEDIFGLPSQGSGTGGTSDVPDRPAFQWALHQNTPNPVAGMTEVRYEVARTSDVSIKVYNAMGQLVNTLVDDRIDPGRYSANWDGRNFAGDKVASGVYFYKMETGSFSATKKMLIVK